MVAANPRNLLPNCLTDLQFDFPYIFHYINESKRQSFPYRTIVRERIRENTVETSRKMHKTLVVCGFFRKKTI